MDSNSCRELAVAIPTCNRSAEEFRIGYVLESLAFQQLTEHTFRVFIWDEGPAPVVSDRLVRLLMDLLGERGHQVNYLRRNRSRGVAAARCGLLRNLP